MENKMFDDWKEPERQMPLERDYYLCYIRFRYRGSEEHYPTCQYAVTFFNGREFCGYGDKGYCRVWKDENGPLMEERRILFWTNLPATPVKKDFKEIEHEGSL